VFYGKPAAHRSGIGEIAFITPAIATTSSRRFVVREGQTVPRTTTRRARSRATTPHRQAPVDFNTIPRPGELGSETWENDSWACQRHTGVWTQISIDEELIWRTSRGDAPIVRTSTADHRLATTCFPSRSLPWTEDGQRTCTTVRASRDLELRKTRHADPPRHQRRCRPEGRGIAEQNSVLYVLESRDGKPVWPIEERPVPQSDVPARDVRRLARPSPPAAGVQAQHAPRTG